MVALQHIQQLLASKGLSVSTAESMLPSGVATLGTSTRELARQLAQHLDAQPSTRATGRETGPRPEAMDGPDDAPASGPPPAGASSPLIPTPGLHEWFLADAGDVPPQANQHDAAGNAPAGAPGPTLPSSPDPQDLPDAPSRSPRRDQPWHPPLMILAASVAGRLLTPQDTGGARTILWIGRRVWPTLTLLRATQGLRPDLLARNILLDPLTDADRVWAIEQSLRAGSGVAAVIADGSALSPAACRRLQLAAEAGKVPALLARAPWELASGRATFATTRWLATPLPSDTWEPRWSLTLLRARYRQAEMPGHQDQHAASPAKSEEGTEHVHGRWTLEWINEVGGGNAGGHPGPVGGPGAEPTARVRVLPVVGDRTRPRRREAERRPQRRIA